MSAALAISDEEGLDRLTLRAVADRLGVTPAALYRLVDGVPDLLGIVIEAALDGATSGATVPVGWRPALEGSARLLHDVLVAHPMLVEAYQLRLVVSEPTRGLIDQVLDQLRRTGLDDTAVVESYATVQAFVVGHVALENRRTRLQAGRKEPWASRITSDRRLAASFRSNYFAPSGFEVGLRTVLDGIAKRIEGAQ